MRSYFLQSLIKEIVDKQENERDNETRISKRLYYKKFNKINWAPRSAVFTARPTLAFLICMFNNFGGPDLIYYCIFSISKNERIKINGT